MKTKNYTDKSAMLVGTDADPVTAGPKHFAENTPEQEKEKSDGKFPSLCWRLLPDSNRRHPD